MLLHIPFSGFGISGFERIQDALMGLNGIFRILRDIKRPAAEILYILFHLFADTDKEMILAEFDNRGVELLIIYDDAGYILTFDSRNKFLVELL